MSEEKKYEYVLSKGTVLRSSQGEYTIKRVLGQGGFGITYEARGRRHGDNVPHKYAIKEFFVKGQCWRDGVNPSMKYSPAARSEVNECLRDFKDEAVRLNKICLGNRNIVNVNEVFEANGTAYYVMEYLEGGSLRDKVRNTGGALSEGVALSYIRPIAEAVEYIHSKYALLHCDIKPDNVMFRLDEDGQPTEPVLIDFGISVHFNNKGEVTTTHNSLGVSPGYSPQEQYQGLDMLLDSRKKRMADGFTTNLIPFELDVYSLGATLYYMLVGENPYDAFSINGNTLSKKLPSSLSEKTRNVVLSAMRSSASERTQTARAFLQGFEDRYYLPAGFVLKSPNAAYSIVSGVQDETDYYIKYSAVLYTGQQGESGRGNTTLSRRYDVYELFEKGYNLRKKDDSVAQIDFDAAKSNDYSSFLSLCRERTGLSEVGKSDFENGVISRELFFGNGTIYAVVKQGWRSGALTIKAIHHLIGKFHSKFRLRSEATLQIEKPIKKQEKKPISEFQEKDQSQMSHSDVSMNSDFGFYKTIVGEAEYGTEGIIKVKVVDPLPMPDDIVKISLKNPAPGALSFDFFLNFNKLRNHVIVYRGEEEILDEYWWENISEEFIEALKRNWLLSKEHWEQEVSTIPSTEGIMVSCTFFYKNGQKFVREVKHASPLFHHLLLDAIYDIVKVRDLSQWIDKALDREFSWQQHEIRNNGISLVTIDMARNLSVYYRGKVYVDEISNVWELKSHSGVQAIFESLKYGLQKTKEYVDFESYLIINKEIIESGYNIIGYCGESDLYRLLSILKRDPHTFGGMYRIEQEMQLLPLCFDANAKYGIEYQHLFCEAESVGGVVEIIQAGCDSEKADYIPEVKKIKLSNYEGFSYFLIGSLIQSKIVFMRWEEDIVLLSVLPFSINGEIWINGRYRDGFKLIEKNTTIPCRIAKTIADTDCSIIILFLGKRFSFDINALFGYNPNSFEIIVQIDCNMQIEYVFRDKDMDKDISISQLELLQYEIIEDEGEDEIVTTGPDLRFGVRHCPIGKSRNDEEVITDQQLNMLDADE